MQKGAMWRQPMQKKQNLVHGSASNAQAETIRRRRWRFERLRLTPKQFDWLVDGSHFLRRRRQVGLRTTRLLKFLGGDNNKKFELMRTRRAKAFSTSCSQTVSLFPAISLQFILGVCAAAEDRKNQ